jgi:hypothetical protein
MATTIRPTDKPGGTSATNRRTPVAVYQTYREAERAVDYLSDNGRRDFTSVGSMQADRYEVLVDEDVAEQARRLIAELDNVKATPEPEPQSGSISP